MARAQLDWSKGIDALIDEATQNNCFDCFGMGYIHSGKKEVTFCTCARGQVLKGVIRDCVWVSSN
jgi:hypothetical protein